MTVERNRLGWGFWLQWILASAMGMLAGLLWGLFTFVRTIELFDLTVTQIHALGPLLDLVFFGIGSGIGVGLLQWLVLRRRVSVACWWVLASTAAAVGVARAVTQGNGQSLQGYGLLLSWPGVVALGGAVTGTLQWLVLRGQVARAGWWVLVSTVGWVLVVAVATASDRVDGLLTWGMPVAGAVLGAVTGGALVWLLRQPVPEA